MKAIVINADPKRKGTNAQIMKSAVEGAKSVGAEVEYVDLYKLDFSGCRVCLICKREGMSCKCHWRDELSALIEKLRVRDFAAAAGLLHNDLEEAVFRKFPVLDKRKADLLSAGACRVMMTGSGPTLFALFESFAARDRAAGK